MACSLSLRLLLLAVSYFSAALADSQYCPEGEPCIHCSVVHSTNKTTFSSAAFAKRAVDVQLANRSDIAYYAQCKIAQPSHHVRGCD